MNFSRLENKYKKTPILRHMSEDESTKINTSCSHLYSPQPHDNGLIRYKILYLSTVTGAPVVAYSNFGTQLKDVFNNPHQLLFTNQQLSA